MRAILALIHAHDSDAVVTAAVAYVGDANANDDEFIRKHRRVTSESDQRAIGEIVASAFAMLLDGAQLPTGYKKKEYFYFIFCRCFDL